MPAKDPTEAIRNAAAAFPEVAKGTSCTQSAFKAGKDSFLYIGPGAKGKGFKAMFKLDRSRAQAEKLAAKEPGRFGVGSTAWVTAWFTVEKPVGGGRTPSRRGMLARVHRTAICGRSCYAECSASMCCAATGATRSAGWCL